MAEPFLSEIRMASFNFPPKGWALCNGQLLPIIQNQALFSLLGTTYGGNGQTTFALPDLQGRTPIHMGNGHTLGERAGEQAHTVTTAEMSAHVHPMKASTNVATSNDPTGRYPAQTGVSLYADGVTGVNAALGAANIPSVGGSQAHQNMQPFLALNFCIALQGIFPSPN